MSHQSIKSLLKSTNQHPPTLRNGLFSNVPEQLFQYMDGDEWAQFAQVGRDESRMVEGEMAHCKENTKNGQECSKSLAKGSYCHGFCKTHVKKHIAEYVKSLPGAEEDYHADSRFAIKLDDHVALEFDYFSRKSRQGVTSHLNVQLNTYRHRTPMSHVYVPHDQRMQHIQYVVEQVCMPLVDAFQPLANKISIKTDWSSATPLSLTWNIDPHSAYDAVYVTVLLEILARFGDQVTWITPWKQNTQQLNEQLLGGRATWVPQYDRNGREHKFDSFHE
jgi:hypothetical protein